MTKYTVKVGDTLTRIAHRHGVTIDDIVKVNAIKNPNKIKVGQVIAIPAVGSAPDLGETIANCVDAIEKLPEFQALEKMIQEMLPRG